MGEVEGVLDGSRDMVEVAGGFDCDEADDWVTWFLDDDVVLRTPVLLIADQATEFLNFSRQLN